MYRWWGERTTPSRENYQCQSPWTRDCFEGRVGSWWAGAEWGLEKTVAEKREVIARELGQAAGGVGRQGSTLVFTVSEKGSHARVLRR